MAGTGSYVGPNTNADYRNSIGQLLTEIPDNASNLINAKDIRDSIWTLWNRVDDVEITASQSLSSDTSYVRSTPMGSTVGGAVSGTTFSGSIQDALDILLYPYVAPGDSISASNTPRQYGDNTSVTLTWSVTKNSNTITTITVDGSSVVPTGNSQGSIKVTSSTHSASPGVSVVQSYSMSVGDGTAVTNASTSVTWMNKMYWGKVDLTSVGNPNLTTTPGAAASVGGVTTDTIIKALTGAGVSPGYSLSTSFSKTYTSINGGGQYLIWAFPTAFGTPTFVVNNLPNTAFTKVRSSSSFVNQFGFSGVAYDVWVSNTAYNSPCTIVIS